jgi:hypothetical protein
MEKEIVTHGNRLTKWAGYLASHAPPILPETPVFGEDQFRSGATFLGIFRFVMVAETRGFTGIFRKAPRTRRPAPLKAWSEGIPSAVPPAGRPKDKDNTLPRSSNRAVFPPWQGARA